MSPRRLADHCDEDDPLASAVLGLWSMLDALAEELGPPEHPPGRAEPPLTSTDELELAVLGLLSVRRTTSWILASLVDGLDEPPPEPAGPSSPPVTRPGELLP